MLNNENKLEASKPKWVNPVLNIIGVNSLRLGDLHSSCKVNIIRAWTIYWSANKYNIFSLKEKPQTRRKPTSICTNIHSNIKTTKTNKVSKGKDKNKTFTKTAFNIHPKNIPRFRSKSDTEVNIWRPPSLSECLTPMIYDMGLTHYRLGGFHI